MYITGVLGFEICLFCRIGHFFFAASVTLRVYSLSTQWIGTWSSSSLLPHREDSIPRRSRCYHLVIFYAYIGNFWGSPVFVSSQRAPFSSQSRSEVVNLSLQGASRVQVIGIRFRGFVFESSLVLQKSHVLIQKPTKNVFKGCLLEKN